MISYEWSVHVREKTYSAISRTCLFLQTEQVVLRLGEVKDNSMYSSEENSKEQGSSSEVD